MLLNLQFVSVSTFFSLCFKISNWSHLMGCVFHLVLYCKFPPHSLNSAISFLCGISSLFPDGAFYFFFSFGSDISFASSGKGLWYAMAVFLDTPIKVE